MSPIGTIPVRFHIYWAGADNDGAIAGFYYAVVETIPVPPPGLDLPALPGPKPRDYRFTTKTDTTIIFDVSEDRKDRAHAFFIYAVDDKGKPDPTPARFIFNSYDRFPPDPHIDLSEAVGLIYRELENGTLLVKDTTLALHDTLGPPGTFPHDTIPASSGLTFRWHGEPTIQGTYVTGYKYKLDESHFIEVPPDSTSHTYPLGTVTPGTKLFTLKVLDQAGGAAKTTRSFQMNYTPDTWFAGPDPNLLPLVNGERSLTMTDWPVSHRNSPIPQLAGSMLSSDSLTRLPAERKQSATFFELYKDKIYIRSEGDTVNMNSWVLFHAGGTDIDSPYNVAVRLNEPALQDTQFVTGPARVVRPGGPNGSPIGFNYTYYTVETPFGSKIPQLLSGLVPVFDAARVDDQPTIGTYLPMNVAGQVYLTLKSVDGNGGRDNRFELRDYVDNPNSLPDPKLKSRIIIFYVDKPPRFDFTHPGFTPRPDTTFFTRDNIKFNLFALDDDPFDLDPENRPTGPGGPSRTTVLRWTVSLRGKTSSGNDTTVTPPDAYRVNHPDITINMNATPANSIVSQDVYAEIELCDCADCEVQQGSGRCIKLQGADAIHFQVPPPSQAATPASSMLQGPRPGPNPATGRSMP